MLLTGKLDQLWGTSANQSAKAFAPGDYYWSGEIVVGIGRLLFRSESALRIYMP